MASCKKIKGLKRSVCIGSLDRKIEIDTREIKAPRIGSVDYGEEFNPIYSVWANITTKTEVIEFDSTNTAQIATHIFIIRYKTDITAESWIRFGGSYYNILKTENLEQRNEYLKLLCTIRGDDTQQSNFA